MQSAKRPAASPGAAAPRKKKPRRKDRPFDMDAWGRRYVALKFAYLGWSYQGLASQADTDNTVEAVLFAALRKTKLIVDRAQARYSRCGRTDKGVSALGQVVALELRSVVTRGEGVVVPCPSAKAKERELDYVRVLNGVLPPEVRVLGWAPVGPSFNARFSCLFRTYRYFFLRKNLDIERMREACAHFVGLHDFRNFCKMDVSKTTNFSRRVLSFSINPVDAAHADGDLAVWEFHLSGHAFLWHQVRCMVAVLFLVGARREEPGVVAQLLDVATHPRKPQYTMAPEEPLMLCECGFEALRFRYTSNEVRRVHEITHRLWEGLIIRATLARRVSTYLTSVHVCDGPEDALTFSPAPAHSWDSPHRTAYVPLLARDTGPSLEERVASAQARQRAKAAGHGK